MHRVKDTVCPLYNQLNQAGRTRKSDLQQEVNKSGFHEKDQDVLHRTPPSFQTKILHDGHSLTPGIVFHDERLQSSIYHIQMTCHSLYAMIAVVIALVPIESPRFAIDRKLYPMTMYQASKPDGVDNCIR